MDITVRGRKCEVSDRFAEVVEEKLEKFERIDERVDKVAVTVSKAVHSRLPEHAERVELTFSTVKGTVLRAEASAVDRYSALDAALDRLSEQLRRVHDRRRVHHGRRSPKSVHEATAPLIETAELDGDAAEAEPPLLRYEAGVPVEGDGPLVVREKAHTSEPMTLADALEQMELVGHDFFLFVDAESMEPSVAYRRRGYDFGVIRLAGVRAQQVPQAKRA
jgi:ribosomal subunit interface protein